MLVRQHELEVASSSSSTPLFPPTVIFEQNLLPLSFSLSYFVSLFFMLLLARVLSTPWRVPLVSRFHLSFARPAYVTDTHSVCRRRYAPIPFLNPSFLLQLLVLLLSSLSLSLSLVAGLIYSSYSFKHLSLSTRDFILFSHSVPSRFLLTLVFSFLSFNYPISFSQLSKTRLSVH